MSERADFTEDDHIDSREEVELALEESLEGEGDHGKGEEAIVDLTAKSR